MFNFYYPADTYPLKVKAHGGLVVMDRKFLYLQIEKKKVRDFGGKAEPCDDNVFQTACREFVEESGIKYKFSYDKVQFYTVMQRRSSIHLYYTFYYYDPRLSNLLSSSTAAAAANTDAGGNTNTTCKVMKLPYLSMWRVSLPVNTSYKFCHRMNNSNAQLLNCKVLTTLNKIRLL
uniref:Nudix hydrolase n=1 Tax=Panulirus argus virus 1 TaxID=380624 RepID=A0A6G9HEM0_9VIRU|nr:nudix hydrolase [Panulirus argus virus 1]